MTGLDVSLDLLRKHDVPGPRYTSYPPATHFTDHPDMAVGAAGPLSLYFHLPFCSTQCLYCGCANIVTRDFTRSAAYLELLERELALRAPFIPPNAEVAQVQLGGGTPTFFQPDELIRLGEIIRGSFPMAEVVEAGVEIDPRSLTREKLAALKTAGFNRASLGVQDTCPEVQQSIARVQPLDMIAEKTEWLRDAGMDSINFDLIYGLPKQTEASFNRTIDEALTLAPDRFAIYSYAHIPWIKSFQKSYEEHLPDAELKMRLLRLTIEKLTSAGYVYIGMDHFARPDDAMAKALADGTLQRNFQGYSTLKGVELHGFGMSAITHAAGRYHQNHKTLSDYQAAIEAGELPLARGYAMTNEDHIRYHVIMRVMCDLRVDYAAVSEEIGVDFERHFKKELASLDDLEADGLLRRESAGLRVTSLGRLFVRVIAMRFDAYLQAGDRKGRYSRTV